MEMTTKEEHGLGIKIKMKMNGNKILKMIALGLAKIPIKLALVIAHRALDWLYG